MERKLKALVSFAMENNVSDVHFHCKDHSVQIYMRNENGIQLYDEEGDIRYVTYLRYICNLDMSSSLKLQSGQCEIMVNNEIIPLRFSYLKTSTICNGVLRILKVSKTIDIDHLSTKKEQNQIFKSALDLSDGLILFAGATGSGKTTSMYAILDALAKSGKNIITLEDPIEMYRDSMVQIQVHESSLTYSDGLKQALRHDPDVLMVGEIRDVETARTTIRCALSGHLVLSTIHAKSASGAILRLLEMGINEDELESVLRLVCYQKIMKGKKTPKVCLYEILKEDEIEEVIHKGKNYDGMVEEVKDAIGSGFITKSEAKSAGFVV